MAVTTTNMGLKEWDLGGDSFSHSDLVANWNAIDTHDHSSGKGAQIPTGGISNLAVTGPKIAANAIDSSKVVDGSLTDLDLTSPNNSIMRTIFSIDGMVSGSVAGPVDFAVANGGNYQWIGITPSDFAVAGKTTNFRLRVTSLVNAAAPVSTFTIGVYPITAATGGSAVITPTIGAVIAASNVSITTPIAGSVTLVQSGDFSIASPGIYCVRTTLSATTAAASVTWLMASIQVHNT